MLAFLTRRQEKTPQAEATAAPSWPEGVIARYQTLANATVDLTHTTEGDNKFTVATCTGCPASKGHGWANSYRGDHSVVRYQDKSKGDSGAHQWAQEHAAKCRALPKSTA